MNTHSRSGVSQPHRELLLDPNGRSVWQHGNLFNSEMRHDSISDGKGSAHDDNINNFLEKILSPQ